VQGFKITMTMLHIFLESLYLHLIAPLFLRQVPIRLMPHLLVALQCKEASSLSLLLRCNFTLWIPLFFPLLHTPMPTDTHHNQNTDVH